MNTKINGKTNGAQSSGDKEKGRTTDWFEDIIILDKFWKFSREVLGFLIKFILQQPVTNLTPG